MNFLEVEECIGQKQDQKQQQVTEMAGQELSQKPTATMKLMSSKGQFFIMDQVYLRVYTIFHSLSCCPPTCPPPSRVTLDRHFHFYVTVYEECTSSGDFQNFATRYFLCFLHENLVKLDSKWRFWILLITRIPKHPNTPYMLNLIMF